MQRGRLDINSRIESPGRRTRLLLAALVLGALAFPAVAQAAPVACFTESPAAPYFTNTTITFNSSCSSGFSARGWDLDNDGSYDDGSGVTASRTFTTPGAYTIKLGVIDNRDRYDIETKTITISNRPPVSSFTYSPAAPKTNESITFTSTSTDADGTIASQSWDFDGDGFDDGTTATVNKSFPTSGTVTARLRVVDNRGGEHTSTQTVTIANRAPTASFSVSASPTTGSPVTFTSTSTDPDGTIASQAWELDNTNDFNDGTGTTASRTYTTPGTYTVKLRVTDNKGAQHTVTGSVTVGNRPPVSSFTFAPAAPTSGQSVTFTSNSTDPDGTVQAYAWEFDGTNDFNDGTTASISRTFATPGPKTVKLRVTDNSGAQHISSQTVTVTNRGPAAGFTVSASPISGQPVTFTSTSTDPDGSIASQAWELDNTNDFNDGTGTTLTRTFSKSGPVTIKLRVTDNSGAQHIASQVVTIGNRNPSASFTFAPDPVQTGEPLTFTSDSSDIDGTIASQAWELDGTNDFNDGTGPTATRTFTAPGTYTIKLRVRDNIGGENIKTQTVTIGNRSPIAAFAIAPVQPISKQAITFTSVSSDPDGTISSQAWEFDGTNDFNDGTGPTATRTFDKPGTYTVKLRVTDNSGTEKVASQAITVANRPPTGSFTHSPAAPVAGDAVDLTATTADEDGTIATQAWDLDNDGQFDDASGTNASFTPSAAGNYPVGLRVTDDSGDSAIATDTIVVAERALPKPVDPQAAGEGGGAFDTTGPPVTVPQPEPQSPVAPTLRWLEPFPVIRIRGLATRQGAKLTLLTVTGPVGATAELRCTGRGCPAKRMVARVKAAKGKGVGVVRFKKIERSLPAGTRLEVAVTAEGLVGKFTRFTIRRLALPARTDRCMIPGTKRPTACPTP